MTSEIQRELVAQAKSQCLPYLLHLPRFKPYLDRLSFVLVGSAATGLCNERSDVDIAIVCDQETYAVISTPAQAGDMPWRAGRPSEAEIDGIQLHYYGISFEEIESKLQTLDDNTLYVYDNVLILRDSGESYARRILGFLLSPDIRRQRIEGKLDMLLRRSRAWEASLAERDLMSIARVSLELIALCLKVVALLDDVPFDPRKRLMSTALRGELGQQLEERIRRLFANLGDLSHLRDDTDLVGFCFGTQMGEMIAILSEEARRQGFRVGLPSPDRRHLER